MNSSLSDFSDNLSELKQTCKKCNEEFKHYKRNNKTLIYRRKQCRPKQLIY